MSRRLIAPAATSQAIDTNRRPDIQGLRAVAILLVVAYHAGLPVKGGFTGVDVFFVISGFVITGMLAREWAATGRIRFGRFYARRARRLIPALGVVVAATAIASLLLQSPFGPQQVTAKTGLGALLFAANAVIYRTTGGYFDAPAKENSLLNTWTLSVEEQFYVLFPALLAMGWFVARRWRRGSAVPLLLVGVIGLGSFLLYDLTAGGHTLVGIGNPVQFSFYSSPTRAWEFAFGAVLALIASRFAGLRSWWVRSTSAVVGASLVVFAAFALSDNADSYRASAVVLPVAGTGLLLAAGTGGSSAVGWLLERRAMTWLGDRSYSWYLWHWPMIVFAEILWPGDKTAVVLTAVAALAVSAASFAWIEQPIRRSARFGGRRLLPVVVTALGLPLVLAGSLEYGSNRLWWVSWPSERPWSVKIEAHTVVARGCWHAGLSYQFDPARCSWPVRDARGSILLAGDSEAFSLADGVIPAAAQLGFTTRVASMMDCPIIDDPAAPVVGATAVIHACAAWQREIVAYAIESRPSVVVLAARSALYVDPGRTGYSLVGPNGSPTHSDSEAAGLYRHALSQTVAELRHAGIGVLILQDIPEYDFDQPPLSLLHRVSSALTRPIGPELALRAPAAAAESAVAREFPGTVLYDPFRVLCHRGRCAFSTGHSLLYDNGTHLSVDGARLLTASLVPALKRAAAQATRPGQG